MIQELRERMHKYKKWEPLVFFAAGFTFDAFLLHRIDDPLMLIHQASYLTLSALIIAWDIFSEEGKASVPRWLNLVWKYREGILHFMLGTLLNVYTIFYFKSGSFMSSLSFLALLGLLLFLNEVRPTQISKHFLRNGLFGLCLISYMNIVVSILVGQIGTIVFMIAVATAYLVHSAYMKLLKSRITGPRLFKEIRAPFHSIAAVYTLLYLLKVLPPVPLSVKYIGIYHDINKTGEFYKLGYSRPTWKIWEHGDQTFEAKPGDKIVCFFKIFSPARFEEKLKVDWQFKDPKAGWTSWGAIPVAVVGGREEGFRGYTTKSNYQTGSWRVSVQTADGREVGRIGFEISDSAGGETPYNYDLH